MKVRNSFVSNSSTSSYVIEILNKNNATVLLNTIKKSAVNGTKARSINEFLNNNKNDVKEVINARCHYSRKRFC